MIQINRHPSKKQMRLFAALVFPAFWGIVAFLLLTRADRPTWALGVAIAAVLLSIVGLLSPAFMRYVYLGMVYATYPIGFVVSHILLAIVYYAIITPIGLLMRTLGKDPMNRDLDTAATTYWIAKETSTDPNHHFKQY